MYKILKEAHSGFAYLVLLGLVLSTVFYFIQFAGKKNLNAKSKTIALITMIVTHLQFLVGLILYFVSPAIKVAMGDFGAAMKDSTLRLQSLEHPIIMLLVVILVTLAHRGVKAKSLSGSVLNIAPPAMFLLALVLALSRIPWSTWMA